jgi:DNA-binding MarR family transcriptional regulator
VKTIKQRTITYARRYPGQSATQIAHAIRAKASTVSSVLHKACARGELVRSDVESTDGRCHWHSRGGGGPAGGHVYGPVRA